jgi:hypothetical protein
MPACRHLVPAIARLMLVGTCFGAAQTAGGQSTPATPSRSTVVVVLPATDPVAAPRIAHAIDGREVAALYTTDMPATSRVAQSMHSRFGGSLIPYDRLSRSAVDFGDLLFQNAVNVGAQRHPGEAILVVVEPDLLLPFFHRALGPQTTDSELAKATQEGFVITFGSAGQPSVSPLPF